MPRTVGVLIALTLLLPLAAAAPGEPALPDATHLRDAAARAGAPVAAAASGAANAAASGAATAVDAIAAGLAALASAVARAAAALAGALAAVAGAISAALALAGAGLASLASRLALLLGDGVALVRAHPKESAVVAGSAVGASGLAWLLKRLGWLTALPLYTRLAPGRMLDNEARNRVYEHVRANPGAHPSGIADALDLGWGTVVYHLQRLEESKLVVAKSASHRKCYFATGTELTANARAAVAAMTHDKARLIVSTVRESPGISQKDLAERVGMSQALASWHVKRLVTNGVLLCARSGRSNMLHVAEHVPRVEAPAVVAA